MNKDLLKTIGGILIIAAIVVATFLYGNQQRQEQVRRDQAVQEQQTAQEGDEGEAEVGAPAPVKPQSPATQPQPATTPETGGALDYLLPLGVLSGLLSWQLASRRRLHRLG